MSLLSFIKVVSFLINVIVSEKKSLMFPVLGNICAQSGNEKLFKLLEETTGLRLKALSIVTFSIRGTEGENMSDRSDMNGNAKRTNSVGLKYKHFYPLKI